MKMLKWSQLIWGSENTAVLLMYFHGPAAVWWFRTSEDQLAKNRFWAFWKRNPLISGTSRLVKYYNLARFIYLSYIYIAAGLLQNFFQHYLCAKQREKERSHPQRNPPQKNKQFPLRRPCEILFSEGGVGWPVMSFCAHRNRFGSTADIFDTSVGLGVLKGQQKSPWLMLKRTWLWLKWALII